MYKCIGVHPAEKMATTSKQNNFMPFFGNGCGKLHEDSQHLPRNVDRTAHPCLEVLPVVSIAEFDGVTRLYFVQRRLRPSTNIKQLASGGTH